MSGTPEYFWDCAARARTVASLSSELCFHLTQLEGAECTGDAKPETYEHCLRLMGEMVAMMNQVYHLQRRAKNPKAFRGIDPEEGLS